jgi:hypothetical protein
LKKLHALIPLDFHRFTIKSLVQYPHTAKLTPYNPVDEKVQEIPFSDPSPPGNVQLDAEGVSSLYTTIPILPEPPSPTEEDTLVNMEKPSVSYQQQYQTVEEDCSRRYCFRKTDTG